MITARQTHPSRPDIGDVARPLLVRPARGKVLLQEIRRDVEGVVAVGGALERAAADDLDAILAHKSPDTALSAMNAQLIQLPGDAGSAAAAQAQPVLIADMGQDLGHSFGPMAFMPPTCRAAGDAKGPVLPGMQPAF